MKHLVLAALLSFAASALAGCDTEDDCGNPFGCKDNASQRMSSSELGELIGVDEPSMALLLEEKDYTPELDEERDELLYTLTNEDLDELAVEVSGIEPSFVRSGWQRGEAITQR
jgi:hypothetical protein